MFWNTTPPPPAPIAVSSESAGAIGERRPPSERERESSDVLRAQADGSAAPWLRDGIALGMRLQRGVSRCQKRSGSDARDTMPAKGNR